MAAVLREIVIDCQNPQRVGEFWGEVLGWKPQQDDQLVWMSESGQPFPDLVLVFVPAPDNKTVKNRVHLDVSPIGCDQDQEVERLLVLGARRVDIGQGDVPWVVLADPEGNEFCVLRRRVDSP